MQRYILRRLAQSIVTLLGITVIIFALTRLSGDPASLMMGDYPDPKYHELLRHELGLDRPVYTQYWLFISNVVKGDFGKSWRWNQPASELVLSRFPATIQLAVAALILCIIIGVPIGVISALKKGTFIDGLARLFALFGQSLPTFWVGMMLIVIFAVTFRLLPSTGYGQPENLVLPAVTLGWYSVAVVMRLTRSAMLDVLGAEYVKMARIKGVPEFFVVAKHALKNAAIPVVTVLGLQLAMLLRGAVVTETVFAWPGVGRMAVEAAFARDFPTVQASVLITATVFLVANFVVDVLYAYLDPRIRYS